MTDEPASLTIVPISLRDAFAFVRLHHRTHDKKRKRIIARFAVGVARGEHLVAVAITGNPKARALQDGWTAEVVRVCSIDPKPDGKHASCACSMLYATSWRAARALGFRRIVTYTLPEEGGASLRGAGWSLIGEAGGGSWNRPARPRIDDHPTQIKLRWERRRIAETCSMRDVAASAPVARDVAHQLHVRSDSADRSPPPGTSTPRRPSSTACSASRAPHGAHPQKPGACLPASRPRRHPTSRRNSRSSQLITEPLKSCPRDRSE